MVPKDGDLIMAKKSDAIAQAEKLRNQGQRQAAIDVALSAGLMAADVPFIEAYPEPSKPEPEKVEPKK
jgi:hypothetical protein